MWFQFYVFMKCDWVYADRMIQWCCGDVKQRFTLYAELIFEGNLKQLPDSVVNSFIVKTNIHKIIKNFISTQSLVVELIWSA